MEVDARTLDASLLDADVCIVGAGPAGLALARRLARGPHRIVVLESGGRLADPEVQRLNEGETSGDAYAGLTATRHRQAGGTVHTWNTLFEQSIGAKYVPLDALDFETRPWWPLSGWPFDRAHLEPYYAGARSICGLGPGSDDGAEWASASRPCLTDDYRPLVTAVYHFGPARLFTEIHLDELRRAHNVLLCLNATLVELERPAGQRSVSLARAQCLSGRRLSVRARMFVLAAGGIENARLLLLAQHRHGLDDESGLLGRCFMEHPRDSSRRLVPSDRRAFDRYGLYDLHRGERGVVSGRLALTESTRRRQQLPAMSVSLSPLPRELPWPAAERWRARLLGERPRRRTGWSRTRAKARRFSAIELLLNLEQAPHPDNRITLSEERDRFGLPKAALHWRWRAFDQDQLVRLHAVVAGELERLGLGRVEVVSTAPPDPNAHHHMGTTRMHQDPRRGVVDQHGRVHGLANLFVAGSSLFPTAGFANPTLTIVALALRLAEHLEQALS
jgi:choline dehydrogenase-like flavoprotein